MSIHPLKLFVATFVPCVVVPLAVSGCATPEGDASTTQPEVPSSSTTYGSRKKQPQAESAALREVPGLKVLTECGVCRVRASVPARIAEGYASAAAERRAKVAAGEEVTVSILEYSERDDAARFFFGALSGKDEIKALVSFQGNRFIVEDYYMNAWLGIDQLATRIGEMIFERIGAPGAGEGEPASTRAPRGGTPRHGRGPAKKEPRERSLDGRTQEPE